MAKGENIFKRKDGRWEARYARGRSPSGKILYGYCYGKTYREAKEKVTRYKAEIFHGKHPSAGRSRRLFADFCDDWLRMNRNRLKASTFVKYETILRLHIKPGLGAWHAADITTEAVSEFTETLLGKALSPKTVKDILTLLRTLLKDAARQNPGMAAPPEIIYPKIPKTEMRVLKPEEQNCLLRYLATDMDTCKFGVLLAMLTGMRIGEICALQWGDIDLNDRTVRVHSTMQRLKNYGESGTAKTYIVITAPKSDSSLRVIPLTGYATELCRRMDSGCPGAYVLTGRQSYMEPRVLQYRFQKYTRECHLEDVHFHTLRHTFATRCVEAGFEIKSLSEILGHASTAITLERYVHSSMELKRANMDKLSRIGW